MATDGGRSRGGRAYIIGGPVLAFPAFLAAAGVASFPYLFQSQSGTNVVVARNEITARTKIQAGDLTLRVINPAPPESFTNISAVAGKGARVDIPAGAAGPAQPIPASSRLLSATENHHPAIPPGYVAGANPA